MAELRKKIQNLLVDNGGFSFMSSRMTNDTAFEAFLDDISHTKRPDNPSREVCMYVNKKVDFLLSSRAMKEAMDNGITFKILLVNPEHTVSVPLQDELTARGSVRTLKDPNLSMQSFTLFAHEHYQFQCPDGKFISHAFIRQDRKSYHLLYEREQDTFDSLWKKADPNLRAKSASANLINQGNEGRL